MKKCLTVSEYNKAYGDLKEKANFDLGFWVMAVSSVVICVLGFALNSASIIIGSMLIAPLLYPLLAVSASIYNKDFKNFGKSIVYLLGVIILLVIIAAFITLFLDVNLCSSEIIQRIEANKIIYFAVALLSGLAAMVAFYWPGVVEAIPGTAISVALVPPLTMVGIYFANFDIDKLEISSVILGLNVLGILIGSIIGMILLRLVVCRK